MLSFTLIFIVILYFILKVFVVVPQESAFIVERWGKFQSNLEAGFHFLVPFMDKVAYKQNLKEEAIDVPPQICITKDNVSVEVDGILYLKVLDAYKASYGIENFMTATIQLAQTTLRSEIGKLLLDNTFSERETINSAVVKGLDLATEPWGIKVTRYEIKNINPPKQILIEMENQMRAERERRAEITLSEGEREARINKSAGDRQEAINISEGEKIRLVNEAEGKAFEIEIIAKATGNGLKLVNEAISKDGGKEAVRFQINQSYIGALGNILDKSQTTILPESLANITGAFQGLSKVTNKLPEIKGE